MQIEEKEIRRLANLYWDGKIPLKDEATLFEFISNDVNREKYMQWEKEWRESRNDPSDMNQKWQQLQNRIRIRGNISGKTAFKRSIPLWKKLSVAAAIVLLLVVTTMSVRELTSNRGVFVVETPLGEKSKLCLPDGSIVWLNAGSQIQYTGQFNLHDRTVALTGEAYFEVKKQTAKPFVVKLRDYDIEVKGTKFNVSSYENEKYAVTTLMEGAISLRYNGKEFGMKPGETMLIDIREKTLHRQQSNTTQYNSWTEDRIEFDEIMLNDLFNRLSRQYNVRIHVDPEIDLNTLLLSVSFKNRETINEIFYGISKVTSIQYQCKNDTIYVSKK